MGIFFFFFIYVHDTLSSRAILLPLLLPQILIWGVGGS